MEHAAGTTPLHNKLLIYANICDLTETWYQEAKGVGKWSPVTHAKDSKAHVLASPKPKSMPLSNGSVNFQAI